MNEHDQLREQMWNLVYDLATPEDKAALEGRIKSDPKVARLYAEVSLEADLIAQAARVDDASVTLPQVEPRREKVSAGRAKEVTAPTQGAGISRSLHWLAAVAASALVVVLTLGTFWQTATVPRQEHVVVWVRPDQHDRLVEAVGTTFQIETKYTSGDPAQTKLKVQYADSSGQTLYEQEFRTDSAGKAKLSVPGTAVAVGGNLRVLRDLGQLAESPAPRSSEQAETIAEVQKREEVLLDAPLEVAGEPIRATPLFDKDWYAAGDDARFRVVPQTVITRRQPDVSTLAFRLQTPDGRSLASTETIPIDESGIVTGKFQLPSDAPPGRYLFAVEGRSHAAAAEEASIQVADASAKFGGTLLADMANRGDRLDDGGAAGEAGRGGSASPGGGGYGGGAGVAEQRESSRDKFMKLSGGKVPKGEAAGAAGGAPGSVPAAAAATTPGESAPQAPRDPSRPLRESVDKLLQENERLPAQQPSDAKKLAQQPGQRESDGKQSAGTLQVAVPPEFDGKPVKVEAYFNKILLGKEVVAATADDLRDKASNDAAAGQPSRTAALALAPWIDGEKVDLVFQDANSPSSQAVTKQVEIPSLLDVGLAETKQSYAPGEKVRLLVAVTNRFDGLAVPNAALGVVVKPAAAEVDEVLEELAKASDQRVALKGNNELRPESAGGKDRSMAMSRRKMAPSEKPAAEEETKNKDELSAAPRPAGDLPPTPAPIAGDDAKSAETLDIGIPGVLLLSEMDGSKSVDYESRDQTRDFFAVPPAPVVISNEATVKKALEEEEAERSVQHSQMAHWRSFLGRVLLGLGVVMLLALGVAFAVQRPAKALIWVPSLGIVVASFVVGVMWLKDKPRNSGKEVAQTTYPDATHESAYGRLKSPAPAAPMSDLAATDSEGKHNFPISGPEMGADAPNEFNGIDQRGGARDEAILRQSAIDQPTLERSEEGPDRIHARTEPPPKDILEGAVRAKRFPAPSSNSPARPDAVAKEALPAPSGPRKSSLAEEGEKKSDGEANQKNHKPAYGPEALKSLSSQEMQLKMEMKRTRELSKGAELSAREIGDAQKIEDSGENDKEFYRRATITGVWQPLLTADENGRAVIEFTMPEAPGTYRLVLDVHGLGHIGQFETRLRCEPLPAAPAAPAEPAATPAKSEPKP
ncbi:MAG TPA: MG2 domain-containing protein [Pirellulaceae bacterium]|nr:MG2 domain-containing protein [Pirellulaceae bacterium]